MPAFATATSPSDITVSTTFLGYFARGMRRLGLPVDEVAQRVGLTPRAFDDPNGRVCGLHALRWVWALVETSGHESSAIELAQHYQPGDFGVLDYLAHSSATLATAIERMCRYETIHHNAQRSVVTFEGPHAVLSQVHFHRFALPRQVAESSIANLVAIARSLTGGAFPLVEVAFAHGPPRDLSPYEAFFRCPITWHAAIDRIVAPREVAGFRVQRVDEPLARALELHVRSVAGQAADDASITHRVRAAILGGLEGGAPSAADVARRLGTSVRTMQRQLDAEQTTYHALLDGSRHALALRYLRQPELGVLDVAHLLGFADERSLRRAFRRWTGSSPADYRRS